VTRIARAGELKNNLLVGLFLVIFSCFFLRTGFCLSEKEIGQAAEKAGKFREAFSHYVSALASVAEGTADDQRIREKIIEVARKLDPPPAVSEEAERHLARGRAAVKLAQGAVEYNEAIQEFKEALRLAPWLAEAYFNLGLVQDKAGRHDDAIRSLQFYLLAAPNAPDLKEVQSLIFEIEYRKERALRKAEEEAIQAAEVANKPEPEILSVDLPETIPADDSDAAGTVYFKDNQGDIVEIRFDVVQARQFTPFRFKPDYVKGRVSGGISFNVHSEIRQLVTLKVTLIDEQGNHSDPVTFTFEAM